MNKSRSPFRGFVIALMLVVSSTMAFADLDRFLANIDVAASKDIGSFRSDLRLSFNVSDRELDGLFEVSTRSSDVYMFLRIGELARVPTSRVVEVYRDHRGEGWGVMAKRLGIKPGSSEFHALKSGRLASHGHYSAEAKGNGKGNSGGGKGKGNGKGKGKGNKSR